MERLLFVRNQSKEEVGMMVFAALLSALVNFNSVADAVSETSAKIQSVVDLQPHAITETVSTPETEKSPALKMQLTNLNPNVGSWYVLAVTYGKESLNLHLELQSPETDRLQLSDSGLKITRSEAGKVDSLQCATVNEDFLKVIKADQKTNHSYSEICEDRIVIRHQISGRQTAKEFVTSFLRDHVWGGEKITTIVKETFYQDKYLLSAKPEAGNPPENTEGLAAKNLVPLPPKDESPLPAKIEETFRSSTLSTDYLGIRLEAGTEKLVVGQWYPVAGQPGMHISIIEAGMIDKTILASHKNIVGKLDPVESDAIVLLISFKRDKFDAGFMIGTDHPRVDWSERALESSVDKTIPGPDGIATIDPLVGTGKVIPNNISRTVASFVGGFKRSHGAFKWGSLAKANKASHYGFIEQGVVLSKLVPGLSTVIINQNNEMSMKTWAEEDDKILLPTIKHARQNGVPIVDGIEASGGSVMPIPGALVNQWGPGNWSGSVESKLRALRAGLCHQKNGNTDYMIYSYFSTATPNAMARVFQAYDCDYGMHLDMNALEHTYFAVYDKTGDEFSTQHLIKGMHVLDSTFQGKSLPRFLGSADNRDFFYLMRKP